MAGTCLAVEEQELVAPKRLLQALEQSLLQPEPLLEAQGLPYGTVQAAVLPRVPVALHAVLWEHLSQNGAPWNEN